VYGSVGAFWAVKRFIRVLDSYEDLMQPMFLRLGGDVDQVWMDQTTLDNADVIIPSAQPQSIRDISIESANSICSAHRAAMREIEEAVLARVYSQTPQFFESLIIDLLLSMGYAQRRRDLTSKIGRSRDGGVDGIISQDLLGLDVILIQAKRIKLGSSISASQIRDFIGTLETKKATKGIFVTTGTFSAFAKSAIERVSHRVRLIDGRELSALMVRHNIGVKPTQSYVFKELDSDYFIPAGKMALINRSMQK
jgi:restriction system protein